MIPCLPAFINDSFNDPYFDNLLAEFDNSTLKDVSNNTSLDLETIRETQELFSKSMKRKSSEANTDFQTLTKKAHIEPSTPLTSEVSNISPELRPIIGGAINRILDATGAPLEELQTYYAKVFNVDPQDIKNICSASTNCPPAKKRSEIKIIPLKKLSPLYLDLTSPLQTAIISSEDKKILADLIDQISNIAGVPPEQIQTFYANKYKVGLQDIKDICFSVSTNRPTANETSEIEQIGPRQS